MLTLYYELDSLQVEQQAQVVNQLKLEQLLPHPMVVDQKLSQKRFVTSRFALIVAQTMITLDRTMMSLDDLVGRE